MFKKVISVFLGMIIIYLGAVLMLWSLNGAFGVFGTIGIKGDNAWISSLLLGVGIFLVVLFALIYAINSLFHRGSIVKKVFTFLGIVSLLAGVVVFILCYVPNTKPVIDAAQQDKWARFVYFAFTLFAIICYGINLAFAIFSPYQKIVTKLLSVALFVTLVITIVLYFVNFEIGSEQLKVGELNITNIISILTTSLVGLSAINGATLYFYNLTY